MKAIILNGANHFDPTAERISAVLIDHLQRMGCEVEQIILHEKKIGNCAGDFFCWIRSPGTCNINDDNRLIASAIINSDLAIYLTPIMFGGYSSVLKKALDHQIQNISPYFTQVDGETHHAPRYKRYPDFLTIGWLDAPHADTEAIFRHLTWRNAINFQAPHAAAGIVYASQTDEEIRESMKSWFIDLTIRTKHLAGTLPKFARPVSDLGPVKNALLLVGSPRTRTSTSFSLGSYLFSRLEAHQVLIKTHFIYTTLHSKEKMAALLEAVDCADLIVLAFPLYVDSLPAPVIETLEKMAAYRGDNPIRSRFAAIANCGFPEPNHNDNALAICAAFSQKAGFDWVGSLALGAGEGIIHGTELTEMGGQAVPFKKALDQAAEALIRGESIPLSALRLWDKPFIPAWLYRLMGNIGWKKQARKFGAENTLLQRPYVD